MTTEGLFTDNALRLCALTVTGEGRPLRAEISVTNWQIVNITTQSAPLPHRTVLFCSQIAWQLLNAVVAMVGPLTSESGHDTFPTCVIVYLEELAPLHCDVALRVEVCGPDRGRRDTIT